MRDDAVLGRALPLDRGLGPNSTVHNTVVVQRQFFNIALPPDQHHISDEARKDGRTDSLQYITAFCGRAPK